MCASLCFSHGCVPVVLALPMYAGYHILYEFTCLRIPGYQLHTAAQSKLQMGIFVPVCVCVCVCVCMCARAVSGCVSLLQRAAADVWSWPVNAAGSSRVSEREMKQSHKDADPMSVWRIHNTVTDWQREKVVSERKGQMEGNWGWFRKALGESEGMAALGIGKEVRMGWVTYEACSQVVGRMMDRVREEWEGVMLMFKR